MLTLYNGIVGDAAANTPAPATPPSNSGTAAIKATVSIGVNSASSQSDTRATQNQGSTLNAGQTVALHATGNGVLDARGRAVDGNLIAAGTQISGTDVNLSAARDVVLHSTQDLSSLQGQNKSASASIGVGFGMGGEQNGFTLELAAARARGDANGLSIIQHNTHVSASDTLTITSGNDTTLMGAQIRGDTIKAVVGGNLIIESLQDSDIYTSHQSSGGFSASICIPPICYGTTVSATISLSHGNVDSTFKSVTEQSGVYAGVGGFDITVGHNTGLKGAVIASRADASQNTLTTGTLTTSDLQNLAEYSSDSSSMSLSYGGGSAMKTLLSNVAANVAGNMAPEKAGDAQGLTRSAIGAATINITGDQAAITGTSAADTIASLNRDTDNANGRIDKIFDLEQIEKEQRYQKLMSEVAQQAAPIIYKNLGNLIDKQPEGVKVLAHAMVGGLLAQALGGDFKSGAAGAAAAKALVELTNDAIMDPTHLQGMSIDDRKALVQLVGMAVGAIATYSAGGDAAAVNAAAVNAQIATQYNKQMHWGNYLKIAHECNADPSGRLCAAVNRMSGAPSVLVKDPKLPEGNIVLNYGGDGKVASFTILDSHNQPLLIMEPIEYDAYRKAPLAMRGWYLLSPQYSLDLESVALQPERSSEYFKDVLTSPEYWLSAQP